MIPGATMEREQGTWILGERWQIMGDAPCKSMGEGLPLCASVCICSVSYVAFCFHLPSVGSLFRVAVSLNSCSVDCGLILIPPRSTSLGQTAAFHPLPSFSGGRKKPRQDSWNGARVMGVLNPWTSMPRCVSYVDGSAVAKRNAMDDVSWSYHMRREMQEILPGLFLGPNSMASKANKDELLKMGITDLILVRQEVEARVMTPKFPSTFRYLEIQLPSVNYADIIVQLPRACEFLDQCFARKGRAFVYCSDGISRGPAIVVGYLMYKRCMPYADALNFVQRRRMCVNLTGDLENQLREYEPICKARRIASSRGESSAGSGRNNNKKRALESDDDGDDPSPTSGCSLMNGRQDVTRWGNGRGGGLLKRPSVMDHDEPMDE